MNKHDAQRRADQLRQSNRDPAVKFIVEPETEGARRHVVRKYRNNHPTGATYYV
jgi:hypothetical protein